MLFFELQFFYVHAIGISTQNTIIFSEKYNQTILGENVYVFSPKMKMKDIQTQLDTLYNRQAGKKAEFSLNRYQLFFMPGIYHLDVKLGYYMQVSGLGKLPDDVEIIGAVRSKSTSKQGHVLSNFWRSVENIAVIPTIDSAFIWGVSQAAPLRRVHVKGNLQLHDGGHASGGFIANSKIDGKVFSGQQQQWFSRNTFWEKWIGGNWNMMFMGVQNVPEGNWPKKPYTVINNTPIVREKPYIVFINHEYKVIVPELKYNSFGYNWIEKSDKILSMKDFYLVKPETDNSDSINSELNKGKNLLFTPGIYSIDKPLKVTKPGTIILGIGLATLQSTNGNSILETSNIDDIIIGGLVFDAGLRKSEFLVRIGDAVTPLNKQSKPIFLFDIYSRIGGPFEGSTQSCMIINSNNVFVDNTWLWRADHGNGVGWDKNVSANGLIVNGDLVTIYGLFVEHFQEYQTVWNGENGKVYFYQSEMPYDPPTVDSWKHDGIKGYASYKVDNKVNKHEAWGLGVYCVFHYAPIVVDRAIETPESLEIKFHHLVSFWLSGNKESIIMHIINDKGDSVNIMNKKSTY